MKKININFEAAPNLTEVSTGLVYQVRGGYGAKYGHMHIVLHVTEKNMVLILVVDKDGNPVGCDSYALHYFEAKMPIAFCEGIENLDLNIRSL